MHTEIIKIKVNNIEHQKIKYAASVIKEGGIVAFPTETVYGLGASIFNEKAIKNVFLAKGRPADNPLIAHVDSVEQVKTIVTEILPVASKLMQKYWPGPLTLIMEKRNTVPYIASAGLETIAVRMPNSIVALELIREAGVPIVAPSANSSGRPSPTTAQHVIDDLKGKVDVIIDAGSAKIGIESTVLDVTITPPAILRPGLILQEDISCVVNTNKCEQRLISEDIPKCPGMKYKHYSPKADLIIIKGYTNDVITKINELLLENQTKGIRSGVMATDQTKNEYKSSNVISLGDRNNMAELAANLFKVLREFDKQKIDVIFTEALNENGVGVAIMNRLYKASGYNIINV